MLYKYGFHYITLKLCGVNMKKHADEMTLRDLLGIFVPKLWLITLVSVVCATVFGLASEFFVKDTYTSTVTLYSYIDKVNTDINDINVAQQQVKTYGQLFKSKKFLNTVIYELSDEDEQRYLNLDVKPTISVHQKDSTEVFDVSVTSTDPQVAYAMAEAIKATCGIIKSDFIPNASVVQPFDDPEFPKVHNSKNIFRNAIIGFAGGVLVSLLAIFIYNFFDVTVRDRKKLEENFDVPILGVIPQHHVGDSNHAKTIRSSIFEKIVPHDSYDNDRRRLINDKTPFAISEAFRTLYTNIIYLPIQDKCKKIAVTSGISGEGKSYTTLNLALTIARSAPEQKVLIIDLDMRRPRLAHLLDELPHGAHGLSEYLAGIDDVPNIQSTNLPNLSVLTSGTESANATALLSSSRFESMMQSLEDKYTYVLLDTPPVNLVSDAILLNNHVNGYFIAARADYSDVNELSDLFDKLAGIEANVFGMCLTAVSPKGYSGKYSNNRYKYGKYAGYANYTGYGR